MKWVNIELDTRVYQIVDFEEEENALIAIVIFNFH